ncbi:hypothetical protein [Candidatus Nitrotoga fabula]|uniref:hypothetical protein n=1 Tax=Candidatus Nitrotoga fabula TaxID=2182327 RepID=UPI001BB473E6|nr:hypothetical protein [Candidatus Nitrotoga fabula]
MLKVDEHSPCSPSQRCVGVVGFGVSHDLLRLGCVMDTMNPLPSPKDKQFMDEC